MVNSEIYSIRKFLKHPDRLALIERGQQPAPVCIYLIITDLCNLDCSFCAYRRGAFTTKSLFSEDLSTNPNRTISLGKIKEIVDDCVSLSVKAVEISGGGDPTTHPAFSEILDYIHQAGLDVGLISNGVLLHKTPTTSLLRCKWIRLSIDAATPTTYSKLKRAPALYFDRVEKNVREILRSRRGTASPVTIGVGFVVCSENWSELYDAVRIYKAWGVDYVRLTLDFSRFFLPLWKTLEHKVIDLAHKSEVDFGNSKFQVFNNILPKTLELSRKLLPTRAMCPMMNLRTYIGADLNIYTCCTNAYSPHGVIGSIKDRRFREFWMSDEKRMFFNSFDARSCVICSYKIKNAQIHELLEKGLRSKLVGPSSPHDNFV